MCIKKHASRYYKKTLTVDCYIHPCKINLLKLGKKLVSKNLTS